MKLSETLLPFVRQLAEHSGAVITPYFANNHLEVEMKADDTPVTKADRNAERIMREMIEKEYPSHGIIGEEFGTKDPDAEFVWVLDPIDGTKSFASACPLFGTLIGLLHEGKPLLGAIHQPVLKQFCFGNGETTTCNGTEVRFRQTSRIEEVRLLTTDIQNIERYQNKTNFETLAKQVHFTRTWGDCYGYLLLATGWADVMLDPIINPWDFLPVIPIIQGAGGTITTWQGDDPLNGESIVATNSILHSRIIEILNRT